MTLIATLAAQAAIGLGFYAFLLFASNRSAAEPVPVEGNGQPLLQDPGLAFHPPTSISAMSASRSLSPSRSAR